MAKPKKGQTKTKRIKTALAVRNIKVTGKHPAGTERDGSTGLYLQVTTGKDGSIKRSWLLKYRSPGGRDRWLGLGRYPLFSLSQARKRAIDYKQMVASDLDPVEERRKKREAARAEAAKRITFRRAAELYIADKEHEFRSAKHRQQWRSTLATYAHPIIGNMPVSEIELDHVLRILRPIWHSKTQTAYRLRGRIEKVLAWSITHRHRTGPNPAAWRGHLETILPSPRKIKPVEHHAALDWRDIPAFVTKLHERGTIEAKAVEFAILTVVRSACVLNAKWGEIDFAGRVWNVPPQTKSGEPHVVPLCPRAIEILQTLTVGDADDHVFAGTSKSGGLPKNAMWNLVKEIDPAITMHGMRSSLSTWAEEVTNYREDIVEAALEHKHKSETRAAYARGKLLDKRRQLMNAWCRFCLAPYVKQDAKVVHIGKT